MFRFTIREIVLATVIVAMGVAWWIDSRSNRKAQATLHEKFRDLAQQYNLLKGEAVERKVRQAELEIQLKSAEIENVRLRNRKTVSRP
jgi:septal ring-binding cell division protein DamX